MRTNAVLSRAATAIRSTSRTSAASARRFAGEIIFIDDDGSRAERCRPARRSRRSGAIRYVSFTRNFGHQAAIRAGLHDARGRAVVIMDADFEHPLALIAAWRSGVKVVAIQRIEDAKQVPAVKRLPPHFITARSMRLAT